MKIVVINIRRFLSRVFNPITIIAFMLILGILTLVVYDSHFIDAVPADTDAGRVIIIDAGHGGEDPGAVGKGGGLEKDINLSLSLELGGMLTERGYTVVYTRTEDRMLYSPDENIKGMRKLSDLKNRVNLAKQYADCLFVSIHMNAFGDSAYSGAQVYYTDSNTESRRLADCIRSCIIEQVQPSNNRAIKAGKGLYLLEKNSATAVIVECGFMSNEEELSRLLEKEYQKQLSFAIVCGIINYIGK